VTTAWLVYGIFASCAFGLAALALEQVCRLRRCATRWVWIAAMLAPLAMAVLNAPSETSVQTISSAPIESAAGPTTGLPSAESHEPTRAVRLLSRQFYMDRILETAWFAASGSLAIVLLLGAVQVRRNSLGSMRLVDTPITITRNIGPAVVGFLRPRIVVPGWFLSLDPRTQHTVLMHEREHITAHDARWLALAMCLLIAMPWNLPLWWQWRRLRLAIEVDCDARILRGGHDAPSYGAALLCIAEERSRAPLFAPAMNDARCALEQRIELLFAGRHRHVHILTAVLLLTALGCTLAAAQVSPPAQLSVDAAPPAADASSRASRALGRDLIDVAGTDDVSAAQELIESGADVNRIVLGDGTPLIRGARSGNHDMVQLLLNRGADANRASRGDGNPLIKAAARGDLPMARTLIAHGADVNAIVIGDETPLINAARRGRLEMVRYLVEIGADVNLAVRESDRPFAEVRSPLSEATKYRHTAVVSYLLSRGAASTTGAARNSFNGVVVPGIEVPDIRLGPLTVPRIRVPPIRIAARSDARRR
jgi:beta-lactamase regulating signal transducer with metallopeptidase domain